MYYKQTSLHNAYTPAIRIDPLSAVLLALALYFLELWTIAAFAAAVIVHELGHIAALRALGLRICAFRSEVQGFCIDYAGETSKLGHAAAALAGPAAGIALAFAMSAAAARTGCSFFALTAGVSLLLSLFNLLPIQALDGGRVLRLVLSALLGDNLGLRAANAVNTALALALFALGVYVLLSGHGAGLIIAALWLILSQEMSLTIEKREKIM